MDIGSLTGTVGLTDQLSDHLTIIGEHIKSFAEEAEGVFGGMAIGVGVLGAAILGAVVSITELGEEGSKILGVENAFDTLAEAAGTTGDALRGSLSDGLRGTISEMTLMQDTSKLLGSGMKLTTDQASLMGQAARELGKATGGDASSGLEMMSSALVTGRTRSLQMQIGLIDTAAGEAKFAASIGVTKDQLNAAGLLEGKRIAILDATQAYLDRLGTSELSFAEKVKQGWVAVEEWGATLAKTVASSADVNEALDTIGAAISKAFGSESQSLMDTIVDGINAFARGVTAAVPYVVSFGEGVKTVWNFLSDHSGVIIDATKIVGALGAAWLVWTVGGALVVGIVAGFTAITEGVTALTVAITANPLGAIAVGAVAAGLALRSYITSEADAALAAETAAAKQDALTYATQKSKKSVEEHSVAVDAHSQYVKTDEAALKKYNDTWGELAQVGETWQETLKNIDRETIASIDYYLKAGVSQEKLAIAFKKTAEEVAAVSKNLEYQKTLTATLRDLDGEYAKERIKSLTTIEAAEAQFADMIHKSVLDSTSYQILRAWEVADEAEKAFAAMGGHTEEEVKRYATAVEAIATETAQAARDAADAIAPVATVINKVGDSLVSTDAKATQFKNTVFLVAQDLASLNDQLSKFYDQLDRQNGVGDISGPNGIGSMAGRSAQAPRVAGAGLAGLGHTLTEVAFGQNARGFAEGGPVSTTGPAVVHAGEYVIPKDGALVSGGGDIIINAAGLYMSIQQLTDAVSAAQLAKSGRKF